MRSVRKVESGKDRKILAREAGMGQVSLISILAGTLVAFAAFAVLLAIVAGILAAVGFDTTDLAGIDYQRLGIISAIITIAVLFTSYFFGGYIAGRLARRAGAINGGLVFVLAILIGVAVTLVVATQSDTQAIATNVRVIGVPTSGDDFRPLATISGILSLAAMLTGAVLGGLSGERWHGKLLARAVSPEIGPEPVQPVEVAEPEERREPVEGVASRPWTRRSERGETDREEPVPASTTQPVPVAQEPTPEPVFARGWNETETRAWGGAVPVEGQGSTATAEPEPEPARQPTAPPTARPRRDRPLRVGEGRPGR